MKTCWGPAYKHSFRFHKEPRSRITTKGLISTDFIIAHHSPARPMCTYAPKNTHVLKMWTSFSNWQYYICAGPAARNAKPADLETPRRLFCQKDVWWFAASSATLKNTYTHIERYYIRITCAQSAEIKVPGCCYEYNFFFFICKLIP